MTCREKLKIEHPDEVGEGFDGGCLGCPYDHNYLGKPDWCHDDEYDACTRCWDREIPEVPNKPTIKDSGERRQFDTGAVRDIQEGKGRCDLMPLDVIAMIYDNNTDRIGARGVLYSIQRFMDTCVIDHLMDALESFLLNDKPWDCNWSTMFLEVAKHFEEGAKKYGEYNWQKGIPTHCYIDSAVRHYLKWLRGDKDEPHDRAFVWNILCCIWTCIHKPELNDYAPKNIGGDNVNLCIVCGQVIPEGRHICIACEKGE